MDEACCPASSPTLSPSSAMAMFLFLGSLKSKRSYKQAAPVERVPTFHPLEKAQTKNEFDSEYVDFAEEVDIKPEPAPRANQSPVVVHNHYVNQ